MTNTPSSFPRLAGKTTFAQKWLEKKAGFSISDFDRVSKEIARIYYRNTAWFQGVEQAKKENRQQWKSICRLNPEPLPPKLNLLISQIYCACTNEITEHEWFKDVPPVKEILKDIKEILPS